MWKDNYSNFMSDVDSVKKLTYRVLYDKYAVPKGMTRQAMYEECIELGIKHFYKEFPESNNSFGELGSVISIAK